MTQAMQRVIERLSRLPEEKQERIAARILETLEAEEKTKPWAADRQWIGGKRPSREEVTQAIAGLEELSKKLTLGGLSIREMIEEGRCY